MRQASLRESSSYGVVALETGTHLVLEDVAIEGLLPEQPALDRGVGMLVAQGAEVEVARLRVERALLLGILVTDGDAGVCAGGACDPGRLVGSDVVVRDTLGRESDGYNGRGIDVEEIDITDGQHRRSGIDRAYKKLQREKQKLSTARKKTRKKGARKG